MDNEVRDRILEGAMNLFNRYGVRSVTMDDVAREVSMSKKTLYQYFVNKDGLVTAVARYHMDLERKEFSEIEHRAVNAIDELHQIAQCMRRNIQDINPSMLYDLQKFHHEAWDLYLDFKNEFIRGHIEDNLIRGMKEGCYREEIDVKILSKFRVEQVQMIFDQQIFPPEQFQFVEVQMQLLDHFIHGILTEKGRNHYQKYFQTEAVKPLK